MTWQMTEKERAVREAINERMASEHAELLRHRHAVRKMGTALIALIAAAEQYQEFDINIRKAINVARKVIK